MSETIITSSGSITFDGPYVGPCLPSGQFAGLPKVVLQQWLGQAQLALHTLRTGKMVSMAMYNAGEGARQVSYTRAQIPQLMDYIRQLSEAVYGCWAGGSRRALGVRF